MIDVVARNINIYYFYCKSACVSLISAIKSTTAPQHYHEDRNAGLKNEYASNPLIPDGLNHFFGINFLVPQI